MQWLTFELPKLETRVQIPAAVVFITNIYKYNLIPYFYGKKRQAEKNKRQEREIHEVQEGKAYHADIVSSRDHRRADEGKKA